MRFRGLLLAATVVALLAPAAASAHAVLEQTRPAAGASLGSSPAQVSFRFDEPVEASFGAVRVFDQDGEPIDSGELLHEQPEIVAVALPPNLPDGVYTATYRVLSADSHPVSGGFTFGVGEPDSAPALGVGELVDEAGAGPVTDAALGVVRVATYASTALVIGAVVFLIFAWSPALAGFAGSPERRRGAVEGFDRRLRRLLIGGLALGLLATLAGIVLEAAIGLGSSFWDALRTGVIGDELETRFGTIWALRGLDLALLSAFLVLPRGPRLSNPLAVVAVGLGLGFLALAPGLAGHLGVAEPAWLVIGANLAHVLAFSIWLGGLAVILFVLPAATARLDGGEKTRLLAATVGRFSTIALVAVAALLATGVIQSIVQLDQLSDLLDSGYGRAILVKAALLSVLILFGARNRRSLAMLERQATDEQAPGAAGAGLRRAIRAEVGLIVGVLAATAVLAATSPPVGGQGPFSGSAQVGPASLELTVDPARPGVNQIHLYLFDSATGAQFDAAKEVRVTAALPQSGITGLRQDVRPSGPGHFVVRRADLAIAGDWRLEVGVRVSAFDEYTTEIEVPIG